MKVLILFFVAFTFNTSAFSRERKKKRPVLVGDLFRGDKFKIVKDFSDEFRGRFNHEKWYNINPRWKGRQPGLFAAKNVKQKRGQLLLRGVYEKPGSTAFLGAPDGYETYTTSFVMSKKEALWGYFEVKAKPGNSRLSSSFWGSLDTPELWTEIDVFEIGGGAVNNGIDFRNRINMNLHVFRNKKKGIEPGVNEISKPTYYTHSSYLRSKYNVYGLDWSRKYITWTFNGRAIRRDRNKHWKQAFPMKFDVETMPYWFGLPSKDTLPATYKIKYIRAWSRKKTARSTEKFGILSRDIDSKSNIRQFNVNPEITSQNVSKNNENEDVTNILEESAIMEVKNEIEPQTSAPSDGLQRPPIPGSKERVYEPVLPPLGTSWAAIISKQNSIRDDIFGSQIEEGENINVDDFDEEILLFAPPKTPSKSFTSNAGLEKGENRPSDSHQPQPGSSGEGNTKMLGNGGIFGSSFPSFQWD